MNSLPKCPINFNHIVKENLYFPRLTIYYCTHCKEDLIYLQANPGHKPPQISIPDLPLNLRPLENPTHQISLSYINSSNEVMVKEVLETVLNINDSLAKSLIDTAKNSGKAPCFKADFDQCKTLLKAIEKHCHVLESVVSFSYSVSSCFRIEII